MRAPIPPNEPERLAALREYSILDTLPESDYDDITALAAEICKTPIAAIILIDEKRQWLKSKVGFDLQETPRDVAFCAHALSKPDILLVPDAQKDSRFADNPFVTQEAGIRFYAGAPLVTQSGKIIGTLCVLDIVPREITPSQQNALRVLSKHVMAQLELRRQMQEERLLSGQLRESETRYRLLFSQNPQPMWVYELSTLRFLEVNDAAIEHYGYTRDEFLQLTLRDIRPPEDVPALEQTVAQTGSEFFQSEVWRHRVKDGSIRRVQISSHPMDFEGKPSRLVLALDVTTQMAAEEALRTSEERFRTLAKATNDAMWEWDLSTNSIWNNEGYEKLFGYGPDHKEQKTLPWVRVIHPADRTRVLESIQALIEARGEDWSCEHLFRRNDGTYAYVLNRGHLVYDADGQVVRMVGGMTDLTERRHAEERLAEQAALLDSAHEAILVKDMENRIIYWNKGAERIYGWTAEEAIGKTSAELLSEQAGAADEIRNSLEKNGTWQGEINNKTKEGNSLTVEVRYTLVRDSNGDPKSILAINNDITEKKKLEAQFLRSQRMESIGTLAGGIAHDLNNMLAPIMMSLEILRMKYPDPDDGKLLDTLQTSAMRGSDLVKQVLSFARGLEGQKIPVNPLHLLEDVRKIALDTFPKSVKFQLFAPDQIWTISGDPTQLHQVFLNLCVNARDAMPDGGVLTITVSNETLDETYAAMNVEAKPGSYVQIKITDTGTGIPLEVRDKIFEPFFTTKEIGKGTGLGLSTTLGIVKSHGGFINLNSELGKGTEFEIYLPATPEAVPAAAIPSAELPRGNGETVLVVDDESAIRVVAESTLQRFGYHVILASNGAEAVALFAQHQQKIAVVLTDMAMPFMDGPSTIIALRAIRPSVRVIGSSGLSSKSSVDKILGVGCKFFVPKPYTAESLLKTIRLALESD